MFRRGPASAFASAERLGAGRRGSRGEEGLFIELSPAQVEAVVRAAGGGGSAVVLLAGLGDVTKALEDGTELLENPRLSRSLLAGLLLLACFPADGSYLGNAQLARMLGMSASTVHRFLITLVAVGLVQRDPHTRRYRRATR
jgi:IclR helix-turn-helix domain